MPSEGQFGSADVRYLNFDDALSCYAEVFNCSVQEAANQLRSPEGLESALARPQFYAHYEAADLAMQAAVLAHGIAETQPFVEGNKRTALATLAAFLIANGHDLTAPQEERMAWMISLSEGATAEWLAEKIRARLIPAEVEDQDVEVCSGNPMPGGPNLFYSYSYLTIRPPRSENS